LDQPSSGQKQKGDPIRDKAVRADANPAHDDLIRHARWWCKSSFEYANRRIYDKNSTANVSIRLPFCQISMQPCCKSKRGLTLPELLCVITIIAILMALYLPAISRAFVRIKEFLFDLGGW